MDIKNLHLKLAPARARGANIKRNFLASTFDVLISAAGYDKHTPMWGKWIRLALLFGLEKAARMCAIFTFSAMNGLGVLDYGFWSARTQKNLLF